LLIFPCNGNGLEALDCLGDEYECVGFVDDTPEKQRAGAYGLRVLPRAALNEVLHAGAPLAVHHGDVFGARGAEECRPTDHVEGVQVAGAVDVGAGIEQHAHQRLFRARGRPVERGGIVASLAGMNVGAVGEQQLDDWHVSRLGGCMKSRPSAVLRAGIRDARQRPVDLEEPRDLSSVASTARREEVGNAGMLTALDLRLEGAPAGEAVFTGD